jgi:lysophospholipase L1-like esterase
MIAALHGDTVVPITRLQPDGVHPSWAGYKQIAKDVK